MMRARVCPTVLTLALLAVAIAGCREAGETPIAPTGPPPAPAITPALVIGCMAPFVPTTTRADLVAAFGEGNVRQETVAGPEGTRVNVTALYPGDAARRAEVTFADEAAGTGLNRVTVNSEAAQWSGPNGLKVGDSIEAVERANGGPFLVSGFGWDQGGYAVDWQGGRLGVQDVDCATVMRFARKANLDDTSIVGDVHPKSSDLSAMRAAAPEVIMFGVQWDAPASQ
jgi:hypothetical protein